MGKSQLKYQQPQQQHYQNQNQQLPKSQYQEKAESILNTMTYNLNENQLNDMFNFYNTNKNLNQLMTTSSIESNILENSKKQIVPKLDILEQNNDDIARYFNEASLLNSVPSASSSSSTSQTPLKSTNNNEQLQQLINPFINSQIEYLYQQNQPIILSNDKPNSLQLSKPELPFYDCSDNRESKTADQTFCNLYHICSKGLYQALLCPDGYLFSIKTLKCEKS